VGGAYDKHEEGEKSVMCWVLEGKPEGKRPLGRPRRGRENGIRMDLMEIGWGSGLSWLRIGTGGELL
jgi:hypothetical protein